MILVDNAVLELWSPDFSSSGQSNPTWTRLRQDRWVLANSLEAPEWLDDPVQVVICDACGTVGCASGSYVHVSRTKKYIVWTAPQMNEPDPFEQDEYQAAFPIREAGLVLIPREHWDAWADERASMPVSREFPKLTGGALAEAWRWSMPAANRAPTVRQMSHFVAKRALACESFEVAEAAAIIDSLATWLRERREANIDGEFERVSHDRRTETIYFEVPIGEGWSAFEVGQDGSLVAVSSEWVFRPEAA